MQQKPQTKSEPRTIWDISKPHTNVKYIKMKNQDAKVQKVFFEFLFSSL